MKVIVDTNILISAVIRDRLPERILTMIARRDDIEWIVTETIVDEYKQVLARPKFTIPKKELAQLIATRIVSAAEFAQIIGMLT